MSTNLPDFDTARYLQPVATPTLTAKPYPALLLRSTACGCAGVLAGGLLYGGFIHLTHINVGYLAIVVAWLIAKAMLFGSGGRGGRPFQIAAVTLTCLSVALGNALMIGWSLQKDVGLHLSAFNLLQLFRIGLFEPFYEFQESAGGALLSLFILFIGLRAAWRMTSGLPGAARHPFSRGS